MMKAAEDKVTPGADAASDEGTRAGPTGGADESWRARIVEGRTGLARVINSVSRVAVLGIKPEEAGGPAFGVPQAMQQSGFTIIPVPVYYPDVTEILGEPAHRSLATIDPPADMVQVFRRSSDVPKHLDEIIAAKPKVVWMQLGIRNEEAAERLAKAGITVVQDRCFKVEMAWLGR